MQMRDNYSLRKDLTMIYNSMQITIVMIRIKTLLFLRPALTKEHIFDTNERQHITGYNVTSYYSQHSIVLSSLGISPNSQKQSPTLADPQSMSSSQQTCPISEQSGPVHAHIRNIVNEFPSFFQTFSF